MRKVTIQEVAKELNLSRNTVAKALNNSDTVAYETRYVVIKKAYEMGYSKLSQSVLSEFKIKDRLEKTKTIVVLARRELSTFWNRIIMGISDELNKNNCKLQFNFISEDDERDHILPIDMQSDISGIIMLSVFEKEYINLIMKKRVPVVFLDGPSDLYDIVSLGDVVLFEGSNSVKVLTKSLIDQGMQKIGFIGDITYCKTILDRYIGYLEAMREAEIEIDDRIVITNHVTNKYYRVEEVVAALKSMPYYPEAIVCANDDIAKDVIKYLRDNSLSVPKDVAVTGFDNKEEVSVMIPSLTTVHIGNQRMGRRLVQQLMWRIENSDLPKEVVIINTEVIIRESSVRK
ncbi:LacI family transcriptional regulator [Anaeromicropila herbilytica]|uniref:LacI family transcriptional regulator n=2 Tax=Anaeromicropila herbilytica TaxID=2785025 RepID=A0A7R7EJJ7_9FIRM|nr:LacI family transcriptional regulator [Anaeromicropila herbilytica]